VLGCGTAVGKTRVSVALLRELEARGFQALGLKPIESGLDLAAAAEASDRQSEHEPKSDAAALARAGSLKSNVPHPLYAFVDPVSPHLAARLRGTAIDMEQVVAWVSAAEASVTPLVASHSAKRWTIVETAGGVFSPLGPGLSNFELARRLDPALWVLVAADSLGVLHDVSATLEAMRARGRSPDHLVLSGAREPDASTGSNAAELTTLAIATPSAVLARHDDRGISALVERLLSGLAVRR